MADEFPSNSYKDRQPAKDEPKKHEPRVETVVQTPAVRRKKSLGTRLKETFIGEDVGSVTQFVVMDVIVPAAKDMIADAVSQGVERMVFGDTRGSRSKSRTTTGGTKYVSYNKMTDTRARSHNPRGRQMSHRGRSTHDFDEILIASRPEAHEVIEKMYELLEKYNVVTVADLYDLVGIDSNYTDNKWGWSDLHGARASKVRHGYLLDLPRPEILD